MSAPIEGTSRRAGRSRASGADCWPWIGREGYRLHDELVGQPGRHADLRAKRAVDGDNGTAPAFLRGRLQDVSRRGEVHGYGLLVCAEADPTFLQARATSSCWSTGRKVALRRPLATVNSQSVGSRRSSRSAWWRTPASRAALALARSWATTFPSLRMRPLISIGKACTRPTSSTDRVCPCDSVQRGAAGAAACEPGEGTANKGQS